MNHQSINDQNHHRTSKQSGCCGGHNAKAPSTLEGLEEKLYRLWAHVGAESSPHNRENSTEKKKCCCG